MWDFMFKYFPLAWLEVVQVAVKGNEQHNPGEPLHWARGKSMDQLNTAFRHQFDYGLGVKRDTDGQHHLAKAIWRLMAQLQLDIEEEAKNVQRDEGTATGDAGGDRQGTLELHGWGNGHHVDVAQGPAWDAYHTAMGSRVFGGLK